MKQEVNFHRGNGTGEGMSSCTFVNRGHGLRVRKWGELALQTSAVSQRCCGARCMHLGLSL